MDNPVSQDFIDHLLKENPEYNEYYDFPSLVRTLCNRTPVEDLVPASVLDLSPRETSVLDLSTHQEEIDLEERERKK